MPVVPSLANAELLANSACCNPVGRDIWQRGILGMKFAGSSTTLAGVLTCLESTQGTFCALGALGATLQSQSDLFIDKLLWRYSIWGLQSKGIFQAALTGIWSSFGISEFEHNLQSNLPLSS